MSDYGDMRGAALAKANCELAQARHLLKVHGAQPLRDGLIALDELRTRIMELVCLSLPTREQQQTVEQAFTVLHVHLSSIERVLREQDCACGELAEGEQSLTDALAEARAARERAAKVEREFLNGPDRVRGKIIDLGVRRRLPGTYEQDPGTPLHPSTADCYAGASDDGSDPRGGAA